MCLGVGREECQCDEGNASVQQCPWCGDWTPLDGEFYPWCSEQCEEAWWFDYFSQAVAIAEWDDEGIPGELPETELRATSEQGES